MRKKQSRCVSTGWNAPRLFVDNLCIIRAAIVGIFARNAPSLQNRPRRRDLRKEQSKKVSIYYGKSFQSACTAEGRLQRRRGRIESLLRRRRPGRHGVGHQVCPQGFVRQHLREFAPADARAHRRRDRAHRAQIPLAHVGGRGIRSARPFPLRHSPGRPHDRHRQQLPGGLALQLLRHRPQEPGRLLRRHLPHGRGAGAAHEAARRRGPRPLAHPSHGQPRAQLGPHVDGHRAFHGALFQLHARGGAGRTARSPDALAVDQAPRCRAFHRRQGRHRQGHGRQRLDQDRRRLHARRHRRQEIPSAVPHRFRQSGLQAGHRRPQAVGEDHPQRLEAGRARRAVLGYDHPRERPRLLCRRRLRDRLDQPLRRDSALPLRLVPPAGAQPLLLRRRSVHRKGAVQLPQIQGARGQGHAHHGRHHRSGAGESRAHHREDRRRPRRRGRTPRRAGAVEEDPQHGPQGTPHGSGHHGRRRHAGRPGSALRLGGSHRIRRRGAEDPGCGSLPRIGQDGRRTRRFRRLRRCQGEEQPHDRPHPRGRSRALRRDGREGTPC